MIVISANKKNLYYRVVIMVALWLFFFYFYTHLVRGEDSVLEIINLIGIGLATLYYTPVTIITTLFRPVKVTITPDGLVAFNILTRRQTLAFPEIDSFGTRSFHSANGRHERVEITYKGNRRLNIADVNVETIVPILEALRDNNIRYTGHTEKEIRSFKLRQ
ncbi:MAG TPA: hypothetical protein VL832_03205 [Puia sp.]|nr:hypothetical protein [Puia sp.]